MDTHEPLANTVVSTEPTVEEEVSQGQEGKDNIHEPTVNTATTQEPIVKTKADPKKNDLQNSVDNTATTQEPAVKMEANQEDKETVTKSTNEVVVTKEPAAEVEQFHPPEVATPSIDSACGRTSGPNEGWCYERLLLLPELQKWK